MNPIAISADSHAFAEIVRQHIPWVYQLALRQLRDPAEAEDAAQMVFTLLLRKAATFSSDQPLAPWLFRTTMLISRDIRKRRRRRDHHERKAAMLRPAANVQPHDSDLACQLDLAITHLRHSDRQAIVLRFFQGLSHQEIARSLAISEDAAKMRVSRAVQKLRGILSPISAAAVEQILATPSQPAPPQLVTRISKGLSTTTSQPPAHHFWIAHAKIAAVLLVGTTSLVVAAFAIHHAGHSSTAVSHSPAQLSATASGTKNFTAARVAVLPGRVIVPSTPPSVYYMLGHLLRPGVYQSLDFAGRFTTIRQAIRLAGGPDPSRTLINNLTIMLIHRPANHSEQISYYRYQSLMTPSRFSRTIFPLDRRIAVGDILSIIDSPIPAQAIAPGNQLFIAVADEEDPAQRVELGLTVSASGDVTIPQVGSLHLAGQSMSGAEILTRNAYTKSNIIAAPLVSIVRIQSANGK